ncbi:hypothetical protein [Anabaena sp. CCY 9402-a]|uniref:hypothetical protein n=1 Tax=Anabaena sp. CCY 9402-a TaxID=3103867 RepID=UPI0039C5BE9A
MNESLYQASLKVLTEAGVNKNVAVQASEVVAKDNPGLPNLGRTSLDQQVIDEAMFQYHSQQVVKHEG